MLKKYSCEIADRISETLREDSIRFTFHEEAGCFEFTASRDDFSILRTFHYLITVDRNVFVLFVRCPIGSDRDHISSVMEYLTRANADMIRGNFEFMPDNGEIRFKYAVECDGNTDVAQGLRRGIVLAAQMFERYGKGLFKVLLDLADPKTAVEEAERQIFVPDELIEALLRGLSEDEDRNGAGEHFRDTKDSDVFDDGPDIFMSLEDTDLSACDLGQEGEEDEDKQEEEDGEGSE